MSRTIPTCFPRAPPGDQDGISTRLLALLAHPVAKDLRLFAAAVKINRDLERMGDHATNIAEDVIYLAEGVDVRHHSEAAR